MYASTYDGFKNSRKQTLTQKWFSLIVKVAYTFDDESKSNCLARYPHPINSRAIQIDKGLLVGAVEFKTCILSMISSRLEPVNASLNVLSC